MIVNEKKNSYFPFAMSKQFYLKLASSDEESFTRLAVQPLNTFLPQIICDLVIGYVDLTVVLTLFDLLRNWKYPGFRVGFKLVISRRRQYVRILFYNGSWLPLAMRSVQVSVPFATSLLTSDDMTKIATTLQVIYSRLCDKHKLFYSIHLSDFGEVANYIIAHIQHPPSKIND